MVLTPFRNEAPLGYGDGAVTAAVRDAIDAWRTRLPLSYPVVIGGQELAGSGQIWSSNPCRSSEQLGSVAAGDPALVDLALDVAWDAHHRWSRWQVEDRATVLLRCAAALRSRRVSLAALEILEAGKTLAEADGDVCEAIDFLEYYARAATVISAPLQTLGYEGERNSTRYRSLGAGAVLPPWNFPLAILTGMVAGPISMGNSVVVKPASETPLIAWELIRALREAGLPDGVVCFLPGPDIAVGEELVRHPRTRFVNFTGSRAVGQYIWHRASEVLPGQRFMKRVVAEMGGKDAIIVDDTADLDAAAKGIVASAFGFQGQKCSACSRVIATTSVHDELLRLVAAEASKLTLGPAEDPATDVAALISSEQLERALGYIELAEKEGQIIIGGERGSAEGHFLQPTVVAELQPDSRVATEEIFAPVLGFVEATSFDRALEIANDTDYGLVGGLYTADPHRIRQAEEQFDVGNLYINRRCTGALVGVQPFGGIKMSGTDCKSGTPDYLRAFAELRTVTERF
jgi:1-pyrroline-5-carboxylate dehydrogenase